MSDHGYDGAGRDAWFCHDAAGERNSAMWEAVEDEPSLFTIRRWIEIAQGRVAMQYAIGEWGDDQ